MKQPHRVYAQTKSENLTRLVTHEPNVKVGELNVDMFYRQKADFVCLTANEHVKLGF